MSELKKLAVAHPYYASDSNYYSNEASMSYETMADFLDEWEEYDVDMNLVYRWDVYERYDEDDEPLGVYSAEVFIILQRKGIYKPISIDRIEETDVPRFRKYLQSHLETIQMMWRPIAPALEETNRLLCRDLDESQRANDILRGYQE
jgi:hypothetical protein